jgi:glycyl-tRNA synthetase
MANQELFKKVLSHAKEYGFIFPSSEIYDGLSAVYDYGQQGVALKKIFAIIGGKQWCNSMII